METPDATGLMNAFAERTGLASDAAPRRCLWTDAFAVLNFLELHRTTGDDRYRALAIQLIEQVHAVLGRHRPDDARRGWLSGLPEESGAAHPTLGGLRIGKPLAERRPDEPFDERLEWERDGQYFHYLTKWMDALSRASALLHENRYQVYAAELAKAVLPRFLQQPPSGVPLGLAWKMSIDLSHPLIPGMSPHDALDGWVTFKWVRTGMEGQSAGLQNEIELLHRLSREQSWGTADPLGIGGLLLDAFRLTSLPDRSLADEQAIGQILAGAAAGLEAFVREGSGTGPASRRLGFREIGLAIGLQGVDRISAAVEDSPIVAEVAGRSVEMLQSRSGVGADIVEFWSDERHRNNPTWQDHRDINDVMLAAALLEAQTGTAVF